MVSAQAQETYESQIVTYEVPQQAPPVGDVNYESVHPVIGKGNTTYEDVDDHSRPSGEMYDYVRVQPNLVSSGVISNNRSRWIPSTYQLKK